jgi:molybdopterin-guanine dinucleotide biosynthesis protein MobB
MVEKPLVLCIVGRKNAGKTELTVALGGELNRRGYRVMTVKHSHGFSLDQPGKDSWRHRHEGAAARTVLSSPSEFAVVGSWPGEEMSLDQLVERFLSDSDVVLAEGFKSSPEPKIEVFREASGQELLALTDSDLGDKTIAVVTDRPGLSLAQPVFLLGAGDFPARLVDFLEDRFMKPGCGSVGGAE